MMSLLLVSDFKNAENPCQRLQDLTATRRGPVRPCTCIRNQLVVDHPGIFMLWVVPFSQNFPETTTDRTDNSLAISPYPIFSLFATELNQFASKPVHSALPIVYASPILESGINSITTHNCRLSPSKKRLPSRNVWCYFSRCRTIDFACKSGFGRISTDGRSTEGRQALVQSNPIFIKLIKASAGATELRLYYPLSSPFVEGIIRIFRERDIGREERILAI